MATIGNISLTAARDLALRYRQEHGNPAKHPFHFLPAAFLRALANVPGVDGLKIYHGLTPSGKEVLLMIPAHIINEGNQNEDWVDIVEYEFAGNLGLKDEFRGQYTDTVFLLRSNSGPCPPPPTGYSNSRLD